MKLKKPKSENPSVRMTRLMLVDIFVRDFRVFMALVICLFIAVLLLILGYSIIPLVHFINTTNESPHSGHGVPTFSQWSRLSWSRRLVSCHPVASGEFSDPIDLAGSSQSPATACICGSRARSWSLGTNRRHTSNAPASLTWNPVVLFSDYAGPIKRTLPLSACLPLPRNILAYRAPKPCCRARGSRKLCAYAKVQHIARARAAG
jgi:hypothetical protein